jgi:enamine deaminase RidA (YjgF/YER057c/UK114 family)
VNRREVMVEGVAEPLSHDAHAVVSGPVRQEFFGDTRPASTLVEVSGLAVPGARLEIEAIAHLQR